MTHEWIAPIWHIQRGGVDIRADLLREIIGNPFKPMRWYRDPLPGRPLIVPANCINLDPGLTWNNATVPNLIREMMEEECENCDGVGHFSVWMAEPGDGECETCSQCEGKRYIPRDEPQWELMPIIADALGSAGCTEAAILDHLRGAEPCPHCGGSGSQIRVYGMGEHGDCEQESCDHCNGTGKRPVRHVRGCWVIELLTQAKP